jgi:hypothetical protein
MKEIKLGYAIGTGEAVNILPSHLIVTGLTQKAGKTTTLESLISRSKRRAIVFRTKIGEKSFIQGTIIPPFFKDRSDWQFVQSLVEATIKEKLRSFERAKIIQLAKQTGGNSLLEFKKKIDERMNQKLNGFERDILTNIQAYLEIVLPKLQSINFSNTLELVDGLNIIDLERFSRDSEVQSLIIRSVLEEVLYKFKDVIIVIPEAWKFIPQDRGNPCKQIVEEFIRQGATNGNFIWIDSQDMSGVDKTPLKQITEWILGYQSEVNEVKHTLDEIPLPKGQKPKPDDIMSLATGVFYLATREHTIKVYVQPFWLDDARAKKVAMGELDIKDLDAPTNMTPFKIAVKKDAEAVQTIDFQETSKRFQKELSEMATDFFNKIADVQDQLQQIYTRLYKLENQSIQAIDEDTVARKIMQKMPTPLPISGPIAPIDKEGLLKELLARVPRGGGEVYQVAPLEKIKKDFLQEAKDKIISFAAPLDTEQKKMLKYIETQASGQKLGTIIEKCLFKSQTSGGVRDGTSKKLKEMALTELIRWDAGHSLYYPSLRDTIKKYCGQHGATEQEIDQVYNHILAEMLK